MVIGEETSVMKKNGLIPYAKQQKLKNWAAMIETCRNSGLPVRDWCAKNQITERSYYYRHRLVMQALDQIGSEGQEKPAFAEVHLHNETTGISEGKIAVRFPGAEVLIPDGMSAYTIESVLRILRESC